MDNKKRVINHLIPRFHLKKWKRLGGKLYIKKTDKIRNTRYSDFASKNFYSVDGTDSLEIRIGKFEQFVSQLFNKIDASNESILVNGKELFILKLYCLLCTYRQGNTTEVIQSDVFGLYEGNQYYFGAKKLTKKEDILRETLKVIELFEVIINDKDFKNLEVYNGVTDSISHYFKNDIVVNLSFLHLSIIRNNNVKFMISDVFAVIENTLDNDHLYVYIPVSPTTAILLVQSLYYLTEKNVEHYKNKLNFNKGKTTPDPYLSTIFCELLGKGMYSERALLCSYYEENSDYSNVNIKINVVHDKVPIFMNSIIYDDCQKLLFIDEQQLDLAKKIRCNFRNITM